MVLEEFFGKVADSLAKGLPETGADAREGDTGITLLGWAWVEVESLSNVLRICRGPKRVIWS